MKSFILMLTFLTRIPWPINFEFEKDTFAKGLVYMPVIGLIIGLPMYGFARYIKLDQPMLMAFLLIIIYFVITGGLHLDGLADYFDGIFSGRTRERILEIMKDSHIGTFGVAGLCIYFVGLFVGLQGVAPVTLLLMPIVGRLVGLLLCAFGHYPKEKGMGASMVTYGKWYHGLSSLVIIGGIAFLFDQQYLIALLVTVVVMALFHLRTSQIIGGITGDVIGAGIEMSQVLWLLVVMILGGL